MVLQGQLGECSGGQLPLLMARSVLEQVDDAATPYVSLSRARGLSWSSSDVHTAQARCSCGGTMRYVSALFLMLAGLAIALSTPVGLLIGLAYVSYGEFPRPLDYPTVIVLLVGAGLGVSIGIGSFVSGIRLLVGRATPTDESSSPPSTS